MANWFDRVWRRKDAEVGSACPIQFHLDGYHVEPSEGTLPQSWTWKSDDGVTVTVEPPQAWAVGFDAIVDAEQIRATCRAHAKAEDACLVQADPLDIGSVQASCVITKTRPRLAATFTGRILLPLSHPQYEIRVVSTEHPVSGERDAIVSAVRAQVGELEIGPPETPGGPRTIQGWRRDPYDAHFDEDAGTTAAEDERLDSFLPKHALSKVRSTLARLCESIKLAPTLARTFSAPAPRIAVAPGLRRTRLSPHAFGLLAFEVKRYAESEEALATALAETSASGRPPDASTCAQLALLGMARECLGKFREAVTTHQETERVATVVRGSSHPSVTLAVTNQARGLLALNDYSAAEPLFMRALRMFETDANGETPMVGVPLLGLGLVRNGQGRYAEAIPFLERALPIFEKSGPNDAACGEVLQSLAFSYAKTGREQSARLAFERAQAILGPRH